ncbi:hypothetical protein NEA10_18215 [Phormidium yuhuli AB48]|uniref:Uncharacterized protein n=1 Tax=Phormidium yuhuli AB48 TaxID=2940671 RepID=A0ABY5ANF2_9CYAN|nr:hypothetical protein [Phormidium yuhuli]USR90733.1 hypothetical protein NEA10_18215 [Phormidium yuhuli AB48]
MLTKILAIVALILAIVTIGAAYSSRASITLRQEEQQERYWPRQGTYLNGSYQGGTWNYSGSRASYGGGFFGGGTGVGK